MPGILHIERPPEQLIATGGLFHGIQLWVNLPAAEKWVDPRYQDLEAQDSRPAHLPRRWRAWSASSPATWRATAARAPPTRPISLVHATVQPGAAAASCPGPSEFNALVYVLAGSGTVGAEHRPIHTGNLAVHGAGDALEICGRSGPGGAAPGPGRSDPGRPTDRRAGRGPRALRHEHPGRVRSRPSRTTRPAAWAPFRRTTSATPERWSERHGHAWSPTTSATRPGRSPWSPAPTAASGSRRRAPWPTMGPTWSWPAGTQEKARRAGATSWRATSTSRRSSCWRSTSPTWSRCAGRPSSSGRARPARPAHQQRRGHGHPVPADRRRLRAPDGHQPPGALRPDRPPARPAPDVRPLARGHGELVDAPVGHIDFDDVAGLRPSATPGSHYGASKLANLLFTAELSRRLGAADDADHGRGRPPGLDPQQPGRHRRGGGERRGSGPPRAAPSGAPGPVRRRRGPAVAVRRHRTRTWRSGQFIGPATPSSSSGHPTVVQPEPSGPGAWPMPPACGRSPRSSPGVRYAPCRPVPCPACIGRTGASAALPGDRTRARYAACARARDQAAGPGRPAR